MRPLLLLLALSLLAGADDVPTYVLHGKPKAEIPAESKGTSVAEINAMREEFDARVLAMAVKALADHKDVATTSGPYAALKRGYEATRMEHQQLMNLEGDMRVERGRTVFYHAFQVLAQIEGVVSESSK